MQHYHEKLVRDFVPENIRKENGANVSERKVYSQEKLDFLLSKINEEVAGLRIEANKSKLADIKELAAALSHMYGYSDEEIESVRLQKLQQKGGFDQGIVMTLEGADTHDSPALSQVAVKALVFTKDRHQMLAVQKQDAFGGKWEIPGGRISPGQKGEEGESPKQALAREISEEIGIQQNTDKAICVASGFADPFKGLLPLFYNIYEIEPLDKEPVLSDEHQAWQYITRQELEEKLHNGEFNSALARMILEVWN